jgi:hypothetical protein
MPEVELPNPEELEEKAERGPALRPETRQRYEDLPKKFAERRGADR